MADDPLSAPRTEYRVVWRTSQPSCRWTTIPFGDQREQAQKFFDNLQRRDGARLESRTLTYSDWQALS